MAASKDQGTFALAITALILFGIMSIVSYVTYSEWKKADARGKDLAKQKSDADNNARQRVQQAEALMSMIGLDPATTFEEAETQYKSDQALFMGTMSNAEKSYRNSLDYVYTENKKIAEQENVAKQQVKQLEGALVALKDEWTKQFEEQKAEADKAKRDLASEQTKYKAELDRLDQNRKTLTATIARKEKEFETRLAEAIAARDEAQEQLVKSDRSRATLLAERRVGDPTSEVADGQVTYVNQATQTAWIDLGEADALRRQVTFSVFDSALHDAGKAQRKGSLEVVRVLGDHIAEVKITSDNPREPIVPGDRIYSQVWQRGKQLRFGLTGFVDLDNDGQSDLQQAKDLIALNGGVVDVSLEEDGDIDGEMTVQTRYLVLGDSPDQPSKALYRDGFQTMSAEAANLGVETITLPEFLDRMGYRPAESTFRFTGSSQARSGGAGGAPTSFRFRTP
ncbi:hypothetical protein MalM25_16170 [Planctomycetes bacterium MalM25]|nr:hypothetical protein MalM25_16170 [Planctomycetes bacterium MalM25]